MVNQRKRRDFYATGEHGKKLLSLSPPLMMEVKTKKFAFDGRVLT